MNKVVLPLVASLVASLDLFGSAEIEEFAKGAPRTPPPSFVAVPDAFHAPSNRLFTGISSVAVTKGGRLWMTWYAGPTKGENKDNYCILATSADQGQTWREICAVDPDGPGDLRAFDPEIWVSPAGELYWFWSQMPDSGDAESKKKYGRSRWRPHNLEVWAMTIPDAESVPTAFPAPRYLTPGAILGKPVVLRDGAWGLPVCDWGVTPTSALYVSADRGKTWTFRGGADMEEKYREADETQMAYGTDGELLCWARGRCGILEAVSKDDGRTWSPLVPSKLKHPISRFALTRLSSGNLLLVKHGPLYEPLQYPKGWKKKSHMGPRSHLTAYLSDDGGRTWKGGLLLDERMYISYPDADQGPDGVIHVTYDRSRNAPGTIYLASFTEADVLAGRDVSKKVILRRKVAAGEKIVKSK